MKNGKPEGFTSFLRDYRRSGRQTVGDGYPFNPDLCLHSALYTLKRLDGHHNTYAQPHFPCLPIRRIIAPLVSQRAFFLFPCLWSPRKFQRSFRYTRNENGKFQLFVKVM
jgi:hypothetical protein